MSEMDGNELKRRALYVNLKLKYSTVDNEVVSYKPHERKERDSALRNILRGGTYDWKHVEFLFSNYYYSQLFVYSYACNYTDTMHCVVSNFSSQVTSNSEEDFSLLDFFKLAQAI